MNETILEALDLFLSDKRHLIEAGDNMNVDLLLAGDLSGWRFKNIPCPPLEDIGIILGGE